MSDKITILDKNIQTKILTVRGSQVMLDRDLALLYGVENKRLNEQVKRNIQRFPKKFRFELTKEETNELVANCDWLKTLKHSSVLPHVFTEQGATMLSAVLNSDVAIKTSIEIMDAFINMRKFLTANGELFQRLETIEKKQISYEIKTDEKFDTILNALEDKSLKPKQGIFYDGQIFDAYVFISDLIKSAKKTIVLIDNYCDESVLTLLSKRGKNVNTTIYTSTISKQLQLDLKKHNEQYAQIEIKKFKNSHDRFLIIDENKIYHIGASLKDLGKKWFAFSLFDKEALEILGRLDDK